MSMVLQSTPFTNQDIHVECLVATYQPSVEKQVTVQVNCTGLTGSASNIQFRLELTTSADVVVAYQAGIDARAKWATANTAFGPPESNATYVAATNKLKVYALSSLAGDTTVSGTVLFLDATAASLEAILGTALGEGAAGRIAAAWQLAWNIPSSTWTSADKNQTGDSYAKVTDSSFGLDKLVRSTTPANTLTVHNTDHGVLVSGTKQKLDDLHDLNAGAKMDLIDAPNETAITAIQNGLALEATLTEIKGDGWTDETLEEIAEAIATLPSLELEAIAEAVAAAILIDPDNKLYTDALGYVIARFTHLGEGEMPGYKTVLDFQEWLTQLGMAEDDVTEIIETMQEIRRFEKQVGESGGLDFPIDEKMEELTTHLEALIKDAVAKLGVTTDPDDLELQTYRYPYTIKAGRPEGLLWIHDVSDDNRAILCTNPPITTAWASMTTGGVDAGDKVEVRWKDPVGGQYVTPVLMTVYTSNNQDLIFTEEWPNHVKPFSETWTLDGGWSIDENYHLVLTAAGDETRARQHMEDMYYLFVPDVTYIVHFALSSRTACAVFVGIGATMSTNSWSSVINIGEPPEYTECAIDADDQGSGHASLAANNQTQPYVEIVPGQRIVLSRCLNPDNDGEYTVYAVTGGGDTIFLTETLASGGTDTTIAIGPLIEEEIVAKPDENGQCKFFFEADGEATLSIATVSVRVKGPAHNESVEVELKETYVS